MPLIGAACPWRAAATQWGTSQLGLWTAGSQQAASPAASDGLGGHGLDEPVSHLVQVDSFDAQLRQISRIHRASPYATVIITLGLHEGDYGRELRGQDASQPELPESTWCPANLEKSCPWVAVAASVSGHQ